MSQQSFETEEEEDLEYSEYQSCPHLKGKCRYCGSELNGAKICSICAAEILSVDPNFLINEEDQAIFIPINTKLDVIPHTKHWSCVLGSAINIQIWGHQFNGKVIGWDRTNDLEGRQMYVKTNEGYLLIDPYTSQIEKIQIWEPDNS